MLAQNFKTPADLEITDIVFEALVKVLGMLERQEFSFGEAGRDGAIEWSWDYVAARQAWLTVKGVRANSRDAHRAAFEQTLDAIAPRLAKLVDLALIAPR